MDVESLGAGEDVRVVIGTVDRCGHGVEGRDRPAGDLDITERESWRSDFHRPFVAQDLLDGRRDQLRVVA
jgi:hypothetical protein